MNWLKKRWGAIVAITVFAIAVVAWIISRKRNPWAAQRILEIQGDTEQRIEQIQDKAAIQQGKLDRAWQKKRKALKAKAEAKVARELREARRLNAAALKRRVLGDLDDPL